MCAPLLASHSIAESSPISPCCLGFNLVTRQTWNRLSREGAPSATSAWPDRMQTHVRPDSVLDMNPDLDGRVIAIAGAGGGLGPVVAQRLADAGATLSLADRSQEIADSVAGALGIPEDRVDPRAVDLLDESAANDWAAQTEDRFGRVDGLLHLVGGY